MPTDAEVEGVLREVAKDTKLLDAIEALYGVSKNDSDGLLRVMRAAMAAGHIVRADGEKWGTGRGVTSIRLVEERTVERRHQPGVGTEEYKGQVIRRDGSTEEYNWINTGKWGGLSFDIAFDADGKERREIRLSDVSRVDFLGPSRLMEGDRYIKNIWAKARVTLGTGKVLDDIFLNTSGIGGHWKWCYETELWVGDIDDTVAAVTFQRKRSVAG